MQRTLVGILIGAIVAGGVVYFMMPPQQLQPDRSKVTIHVVRQNQTPKEIFVTPKFLGVCGNTKKGKACDSSEFRWKLAGKLQQGETLTIDDASGRDCFPSTMPLVITYANQGNPNDLFTSGPPDSSCMQYDYGTYWPYSLSLTYNGGRIVSDPGGIIHP